MQQFKALFKKELNTYFKSYFAYLIFFIYLFVSIGSAFYFGAYLAMHDAALYALFYAQPIILVVLLPAVTMRLWSDEYRSGTAEFLLTQPLSDKLPVLAKATAAMVLFGGMTLFLLPFIVFTGTMLTLDWENIFCCFVGLELAIAALTALGSLISALNKNIFTAYLLSVFAMALWVGLPITYFYGAYNNFLFAQIGWPDLLYFVLLAGGLLFLNILALEFRRTVVRHKIAKFSGFATLLLAGLTITLAALYNILDAKGDFTRAKLYTPKEETEAILAAVNQPIELNIYAARDYISESNEYYHYFQQLRRFLEKYQSQTKGLIEVNTLVVEAFSEMEDNVLGKGLYFEENSHGTKNYFGATLSLRDGREYTIKQFLLERRAFVEKDIDIALLKLISPDLVKNIAVYLPSDQKLEPLESLFLNLENDYNVLNLKKDTFRLPNQLDAVILFNPKMLPELFLYAVDQYVMRGGKLIVFYDFLTANQTEIINADNIKMVEFFNAWGITLDKNFVDSGVLNPVFAQSSYLLKLDKATAFNLTEANPQLQVLPFIKSENGLIGGVLFGHLDSVYQFNPYAEESIAAKMEDFVPFNPKAQVAVVGDVDLLDEANWVDKRSPDRNPYSVIPSSANGEAVRSLIDFMVGNQIYQLLPVNTYAANKQNIGQQITDAAYEKYAEEYLKTSAAIREINAALYEESSQNINKMRNLLEVSAAGQSLAQQEKKAETLLYLMKKEYSRQVNQMIFLQAFLIPLLLTVLLFVGALLTARRGQKKFAEKFNE